MLLLGTLANGSPVAIEETAVHDELDDTPLSLVGHVRPGDVVVYTDAIRTDSFGYHATLQKSWEGRYHAGLDVYQLVEGKVVDLFRKFYEDLDGSEGSEKQESTTMLR